MIKFLEVYDFILRRSALSLSLFTILPSSGYNLVSIINGSICYLEFLEKKDFFQWGFFTYHCFLDFEI